VNSVCGVVERVRPQVVGIAASRGAARTRGRRRRRVARDGTRGASERVRGRRRDALNQLARATGS